jgi:hypothetical protein
MLRTLLPERRMRTVLWIVAGLTTVQFVRLVAIRSAGASIASILSAAPLLINMVPLSALLCAPLFYLLGRRGGFDRVWALGLVLVLGFSLYLFGYYVPDARRSDTSVGAAMGMMVLTIGFAIGSRAVVAIADRVGRRTRS